MISSSHISADLGHAHRANLHAQAAHSRLVREAREARRSARPSQRRLIGFASAALQRVVRVAAGQRSVAGTGLVGVRVADHGV